ncbi:class 1 fructose-bisphosphatase [Phototrophicus methaneseepsis]|uniref:Fructose-1,6-bisphosphatase class 1 n=1 Tax=Phototrophicus methaneseepsis TaxID=2710758 RepID=A0A7S8IEQ7_9CHLR|nr:class 1 fructose-bisphosphatase [Phototrophicus methaneseepsis]QPC82846.1 class 1 fructose-bisphosphatase [Phototrophicus methaneseepsis]
MSQKLITIERHIQEQQRAYPNATGVFTSMLQDMALAAKLISRETNRAGLTSMLGATDSENPTGDRQQKLDMFADEVIFHMNDHTGRCAAMVSEEHDELIDIPMNYDTGNYVLLYDPLDGSSNIDVNVSIGTIFSIHRKFTRGERGTIEDVLQRGKRLVAAGYVVYGSSTMMVYTAGNGVHGFTLDMGVGEFILSHPNITIPPYARYYTVNHGYERYWTSGVKQYVEWLQNQEDDSSKPLGHRYIGSLVADFHRNLLKGGVFLYPGDLRDADKPYGKIRLMYEAQALAFIAEQAGGYASDGVGDILEVRPHSLHQRVPIFIGNKDLVQQAESFIHTHDQDWISAYLPYRNRKITMEQEQSNGSSES